MCNVASLPAVFAVSLTGCYWAIGVAPLPKVPPIATQDSQAMVASEWDGTETLQHVGGVEHRGYLYGGETVVKGVTVGDVTYAGTRLTFAQVTMLADPAWENKLRRVSALHRSCSRAASSEWISILGGLGAMVTTLVIGATHKGEGSDVTLSRNEKLGLGLAAGLAGVGVTAYGVGFLIGGHACGDLADVRGQLRLDNDGTQFRDEELMLVKQLAAGFNSAHHVAPPTTPAE